jgi:hypothetical protein
MSSFRNAKYWWLLGLIMFAAVSYASYRMLSVQSEFAYEANGYAVSVFVDRFSVQPPWFGAVAYGTVAISVDDAKGGRWVVSPGCVRLKLGDRVSVEAIRDTEIWQNAFDIPLEGSSAQFPVFWAFQNRSDITALIADRGNLEMEVVGKCAEPRQVHR